MSIVADQRKRNPNQSRPNVAAQQNQNNTTATPNSNKKANKQNQGQTQNQNQNQNQTLPKPTQATPKTKSPPPVREEPHVPLEGFNAEDVDKLLQAGFDPAAEQYQPERTAAQKPGSSVQKPGMMATGKDFFLELRKQVAALQKGESTNKGG